MKTIYKYLLPIVDKQNIEMTYGAEILSAGLDPQGRLSLWATADLDAPNYPTEREIRIVGTGNPMPGNPMRFIDTVVDGPFVWHVFEVTK